MVQDEASHGSDRSGREQKRDGEGREKATEKIGLEAVLEDADFKKGIDGYTRAIGQAEKDTEKAGKGISGHLGDMAKGVSNLAATAAKLTLIGATAGVTALAGALGASVRAAAEASQIEAQLDAVLTSTGGAAGMTKDAVIGLANSLSQMTPFEDDAIVAGESMLLTFTNIGEDVFPQATQAMLDISQAMGQDLKSSAVQLGKALNDPVAGITALTRVGVTFSEEQKKTIKALVETGQTAAAQKIILAELTREFGGSAVAAGSTLPGKLTILKNSLGNISETIGGALLPALTSLATSLVETLNSPEVQAAISGFSLMLEDLATGDVRQALQDFAYFIGEAFGVNLYPLIDNVSSLFASMQQRGMEFADNLITYIIPKQDAWKAWVDENAPLIESAWAGLMENIRGTTATKTGETTSVIDLFGAEIIRQFGATETEVQTDLHLFLLVMSGDWWTALLQVAGTTQTELDNIGTSFQHAWSDIQFNLMATWNQIKLDAGRIWGEVKTAITGAVSDAVEGVKSMFNALAHFHIVLPHFSLGWDWAEILGMKVQVPKIDISWYGKGLDAIFDKPTIIGVGEAGPERVTVQPLGQRVTQNAVSNTYNSSYVYNISANYAHVQNETSLYDTVRLLQAGI